VRYSAVSTKVEEGVTVTKVYLKNMFEHLYCNDIIYCTVYTMVYINGSRNIICSRKWTSEYCSIDIITVIVPI